MPLHAQPLPAPLVPRIKIFTFKTFTDIESEKNDCSEVVIWVLLAEAL